MKRGRNPKLKQTKGFNVKPYKRKQCPLELDVCYCEQEGMKCDFLNESAIMNLPGTGYSEKLYKYFTKDSFK